MTIDMSSLGEENSLGSDPTIENKRLSHWISMGDYDSAERHCRKILELTPDPRVKRLALHFLGAAQVYRGAYHKAKLLYQQATQMYGEHIGLTRDLACLYYQLEEYEMWRSTYSRLKHLLRQIEPQLSFDTLFATRLTLAKFDEEEGRIWEARQDYGLCLASCPLTPNPYTVACLPQILRLEAQFQPSQDFADAYKKLMSYASQSIDYQNKIEFEYSFLLTELCLFGPRLSCDRLVRFLTQAGISKEDKSLLFYDYLELSLQNAVIIPEEIHNLALIVLPNTGFEELILKIFLGHDIQVNSENLQKWASTLPWKSYLRLLMLLLKRVDNKDLKDEIRRKFTLLISDFSMESQKLWLWALEKTKKESSTLHFIPKERSVRYCNRVIDLSKKKGMLNLLDSLCLNPILNIDEAIQSVWQTQYSPEIYHRLRMTVHRLNQHLQELTGLDKIIEVSSQQVRVSPQIQLSNVQPD